MCRVLEAPSKHGDVVVSAGCTEDGHNVWPKRVGDFRRI